MPENIIQEHVIKQEWEEVANLCPTRPSTRMILTGGTVCSQKGILSFSVWGEEVVFYFLR